MKPHVIASFSKANEATEKIKKEAKSHHDHSKSSEGPEKKLEPPKFHRDMKLVCDCIRLSDGTRHALRTFDAATLEDFSLMTDRDYADLIVTQARIGLPIPPLQQRKLRVLLSWAQALPTVDRSTVTSTPKTEGFELKESNTDKGGDIKASYRSSPRKDSGNYIPVDWESRFYDDLPRLRKELRLLGENGSSSTWMTDFLSLRWVFCGIEK